MYLATQRLIIDNVSDFSPKQNICGIELLLCMTKVENTGKQIILFVSKVFTVEVF